MKRFLRKLFASKARMNDTACHPRKAKLSLQLEHLEERLTPYRTTDPWGTSTISYSYSNWFNGGLPVTLPNPSMTVNQALQLAAEEAMGVWSSVAAVAFFQRADSGPLPPVESYPRANHPTIRWGHHDIDGNGTRPGDNDGNQLGHVADFPGGDGEDGDIHFDSGETHPINQILEIAVHELGHGLGMLHSTGNVDANGNPPPSSADIMNAVIGGGTPRQWSFNGLGTSFLSADDIAGIQSLYGAGLGYVLDINGRMHVYGGQGDDTINIGQTADGRDIVVRIGTATMVRTMQGVNEVWVHGRGGNDIFQVNDTGRLTVTVLGDSGDDAFRIEGVRGANVTVYAGTGTDSAVITMNGKNATLTDTTMSVGNRIIAYNPDASLERLQVTGNDTSRLTVSQPSSPLYRVESVGTVNIQALSNAVELAWPRVVNVGGPLGASRIMNTISIYSTSYVDLTVDDSGNSVARDYTLRRNLLTGLPGGVAWNSAVVFSKFQINGGSGGNQFLVQSTPNIQVTLNTGTGNDRVFVQSTGAALNINGQNGNDSVSIGRSGDVRSITGQVTISNARGYTGVAVDASSDTAPRTVILYKDRKNYNLSGLTPSGDIVMVGTDVNSLQVTAGSGGNTFRVHDTPGDAPGMLTTIDLGVGSDSIRVNGTSGDLVLNTQGGQNNISVGSETTGMNKIQGTVSINGQGVADNLTIDDRATKASDIFTHVITSNSYGRSASAPVLFSNLWAVQLLEGKAADTTNILANPTAPYFFGFSVYGGAGNDVVNIGDPTNQLLGLNRLFVDGQTGSDTINIKDQGRITPDTYRFGFVFGAPTSPYVGSEQMTLLHSGTEKLVFRGGSGGNTVRVEELASSLTVNPGSGDDLIEVGNTSNRLATIASLEIVDTGGNDQLNFNDQGTTTNRHYEVSGGLSGQGAVKSRASRFIGPIRFDQNILFGGMESVSLNAGTGNDYLNVRSIAYGIVNGLNVNAGYGGDTIALGTGYAVDANGRPISNSLNGLFSPVTIQGQDGNDNIRFDDQDTTPGQTFEVSSGLIKRTGIAAVNYVTVEDLSINAGLGNDIFQVTLGDGPAQSLNGGPGNNSLDYSGGDVDPGSIPSSISRYLAEGNYADVNGINPGTPQNGVTFGAGQTGQAFSFDGVDDYVVLGTDASLNVQGSLSVSAWVNYESITDYKYLLADFDAGGAYSQGSLGILGTSIYWYQSNDDGTAVEASGSTLMQPGEWYHLAVVRDDAAKTVELFVNGVSEGVFTYTGTALPLQGSKLIGTSLPERFPNDFFHGRMDEVSLFNRALTPAEIAMLAGNGGSGTSEDLEVNLRLGTATGFTKGISNIQKVTGGSGNDILVGNGGNILNGRGGRDLLIAGALASTLIGSSGDDILIGGTTNYDTNVAALRAIRAEWGREVAYSERVANLTTNNGVSVPKLTSATVRTNGGGNTLLGGADADLFFCLLSDINDRSIDESLIQL